MGKVPVGVCRVARLKGAQALCPWTTLLEDAGQRNATATSMTISTYMLVTATIKLTLPSSPSAWTRVLRRTDVFRSQEHPSPPSTQDYQSRSGEPGAAAKFARARSANINLNGRVNLPRQPKGY